MPKFIELLRSGKEIDCEMCIGDVDMPCQFIWNYDKDDDEPKDDITEYGYELFKPVLEAEYRFFDNGNLEILCDDDGLGEMFNKACAGFIGDKEYLKIFGRD